MDSDSIILTFIFITHLFFYCWAISWFMQISYVVYNIFLFISLLWAVHENKSSAPVFVALLLNVMFIVLDIAFISITYNDIYHGDRFTVSAVATFGNLVYRVITSFIIYKIWLKRRQNDSSIQTIGGVTRDLTKYLNFAGPQPTPQPSNQTQQQSYPQPHQSYPAQQQQVYQSPQLSGPSHPERSPVP